MARTYESFGPTTQKVLLLLAAGIVLSLNRSPRQQIYIVKSVQKEWRNINRRALNRVIHNLYKSRLVDAVDHKDGTTTLVITERGKKKALSYKIDGMTIPAMGKWDKKWRLVIFDIPERHKKARDALAQTLKRMGFYQLQKSVFIYPFECSNEINFVIEFFNLRPFVRQILAERIDNELHLKKIYTL